MKPIQLRAVLYARHSTDKQKVESLEDQFHVCERVAARERFVGYTRSLAPLRIPATNGASSP
jgi:predicted site-specific integrase-resolvase